MAENATYWPGISAVLYGSPKPSTHLAQVNGQLPRIDPFTQVEQTNTPTKTQIAWNAISSDLQVNIQGKIPLK